MDHLSHATLQIRYPDAYEVVKDEKTRKILVLTGLYEVAPQKGRGSEDLEIQFTHEADGPSSYININRFREAIIGNQNLEGDDHFQYRWQNFKDNDIDISRFDRMSEIKKFVEALFLLIARNPDDNNLPAYYQVRYGKLGRMSRNTEQGFANICYILQQQMQPNEKRIHELL